MSIDRVCGAHMSPIDCQMADITMADGPRVHLQDDDELVRVGRSTFDLEYCVRARARGQPVDQVSPFSSQPLCVTCSLSEMR